MPAPTRPARRRPSYGKWLLLSLLGVFVTFTLFLWLAAGRLTLHFLNQTLQSHYEVAITEQSRMSLNPFLSRFTLTDIELIKQGETVGFLKTLQLSWVLVDLFSKRILLDEAHIDGLFLKVDLSVPEVAGIPLPAEDAPPAPETDTSGPFGWSVTLPRFTFTDAQVEVKQLLPAPRQDMVRLDVFELRNFEFSEAEATFNALLRLRLNDTPVQLALESSIRHPLDPARINVQTDAHYNLQSLDLSRYENLLPEEIQTLLFKAGLEGDLRLAWSPQATGIEQTGTALTLKDIQVKTAQFETRIEQLNVQLNDVQIRQNSENDSLHVQARPSFQLRNTRVILFPEQTETNTVTTTLSLQNLDFRMDALNLDQTAQTQHVSASETQLTTQGLAVNQHPVLLESASNRIRFPALELEQSGETLRIAATPDITLGSTQLYLMHDGNLAMAWDTLRIPEGTIAVTNQEPDIRLPTLEISQLVLSRPYRDELSPPLAKIDQLQLKQIDWQGNDLRLGTLDLYGLNSQIVLSKDRRLTTLIDLPKPPEPDHENEAASPDTKAPMPEPAALHVALSQFRVHEGSEIQFVDQLGTPPFAQHFRVNTLTFGPLDTGQPETASGFDLDLATGDYGRLTLSGQVTPLTDTLNLKLEGKIQEIDLPPTSLYLREALGYDIESGQLNTDLSLTIREGQLDGEAHALLRAFDMTSLGDEKTTSSGAITLNAAIGLLKDRDNNIKLDIPIRGNLADPKFGWSSFVAIILKKALLVAAQEALLQSLVPYAGVASLVVEAGSELMKITFAPLVYPPAQAALSESQQGFVEKLAAVLKQNPSVQVKTCAVVVPADLGLTPVPESLTDAQSEVLKQLGLEREKLLKNRLVALGVESARVLQCKPTINFEAGASPEIHFDT